ncbi:MarR family winged helix-turn-helix transcriptional regulator [Bacillus sp. T33-2]|uniref:MarR family winged helix-turn-helix transcriptional regulator n=1 Tax=Bacillus sp. T33-2 TaxID=2054168 RepID=UPI000C75DB52|nr:MarR family transcriptional regulator [Bacillus sp. T33-2]PLR94659.1 MarR family transcriptional regulator [Bacillus sp. T33-2]
MENNHVFFHSIHQLSRHLTKHLNEALEPFGLFSSQWSVLYVLKEKGKLTQTELCDYLAVEAPPMTRTIQRLARHGYIERHSGEDRRKKYIQLSKKAEVEFANWEKAVLTAQQGVIERVPEASQKQLQLLVTVWLKHI